MAAPPGAQVTSKKAAGSKVKAAAAAAVAAAKRARLSGADLMTVVEWYTLEDPEDLPLPEALGEGAKEICSGCARDTRPPIARAWCPAVLAMHSTPTRTSLLPVCLPACLP